ncbi:MAG TPA: helix-turn-helix domain-containing protein [Longimicrobiales bacterium]|nr:helix-turn-helix domain-containing protein [Longimicrobiales bacterium]
MARRSKITADEQERVELRALAKSAHRGEADRARAVLLTLDGRRAAEIATTLGVHISSVREWRGLFARGRVAALKRRKPPGRPGVVGVRAADVAEAILAEDVYHDGGWTLPRLTAEVRRRGGPTISTAWLSCQLRKRGSIAAGPGTP